MSYDPDEQFAAKLAVLEDRIASGGLNAADTQTDEDSAISARLHDALDCLQTLERIWPRHAETAAPALPRTVGRFTLVRELGRGGFGIVHLAEDRQLNRDVAIKLQRPEAVLSPDARRRFLKEAKAAAPLNHPNLVTVYDSGEDGLWCWIASEVVRGPSLGAFLAALNDGETGRRGDRETPATARPPVPKSPSHPVPIEAACRLVAQLADGVAHAHLHNVLHRDIKPNNVLLQPNSAIAEGRKPSGNGAITQKPDGSRRAANGATREAQPGSQPGSLDDYTPKLTDFGLARLLEQETGETRTGARLGTPAYMAPEQIEGKKAEIGEATDVYGLGVLLYELLAGHSPFAAETETEILRRVLLEEPPSLRKARPEVSRDLEAIVLKALEKSPAKRYVSARALADDLRRNLNHQPTEARPLTLPASLLNRAKRHPAICLAFAAGLVAFGMFLVAGDLSRKNRQLLGLRNVLLTTDPPNARLAFVPLHEQTQELIAAKAILPTDRSPIEIELPPGSYLVVAALDDGRFHEVYRRVPRANAEIPEQFAFGRYREMKDNSVKLPDIRIPKLGVEEGMALVQPIASTNGSAQHSAFYLDVTELPFIPSPLKSSQLKSANGKGGRDHAAIASFDLAMEMAERLGKRLPTDAEYSAALAHCRNLPPESYAESDQPPDGFGVVGIPEADATNTVPPIFGLRSNVAEWTTTSGIVRGIRGKQAALIPADDWSYPDHLVDMKLFEYRLVRGGNLSVIEAVNIHSQSILKWDERIPVNRHFPKPGVGLRCARSTAPRFLSEVPAGQ